MILLRRKKIGFYSLNGIPVELYAPASNGNKNRGETRSGGVPRCRLSLSSWMLCASVIKNHIKTILEILNP